MKRFASFLLVLAAGAGCSDPTEPPPPEEQQQLFEADFTHGELVLGPTLVPCLGWDVYELPEGPAVLLDLVFSGATTPSPEARVLVEERGAQVLHEFNVDALRVRIPKEHLDRFRVTDFLYANGVVDLDRFDVAARLHLDRERTQEDADALLESVGGVALEEWTVDRGEEPTGHFPIVVPDAAFPELLERAGTSLRRISQPSFFCLG